jgi:thiamine monophosphate kinase
MKLVKCLVHLDEADGYVEKSVDVTSLKDTQGTVTHNRQKVVVEYDGKVEGTHFFKEAKPTEEQTWLL